MSSGAHTEGEALRVVKAAREACPACPYYPVCPLAPLFLEAEAPPGGRKPHPHARALELYLARLREASPSVERELIAAMNGPDEGLALVSGCLLATGCWGEPERLRRLLESINARAPREKGARLLSALEEHLQRAAAITQDPAVPPLLRGAFRLRRPDREVTAHEAVRLVARLIAGEAPQVWWSEAVDPLDRVAFEASFVMRAREGEGAGAGSGGLDLFFTARAGGRSSVFYYRREGQKQALVPVEGIRADSLLKRIFKVFDSDGKKTHRIFAKMCRGLNNGYKELDKNMLWRGLKELDREHLVVLALYAPRLAKFVEKRAQFPGLYRLVKFLHVNVAEDQADVEGRSARGRKRAKDAPPSARPAHAQVFERRDQVGTILETYGKEPFMQLCRAVFRIAEAYRPGPASADLIYRIGEVAYLLTAVEGFNPRGLEISLSGNHALAFTAYGLQPETKDGGVRRYRRLVEARQRIEGKPVAGASGPGNGNGAAPSLDGKLRADLLAAIDEGLRYLAAIHGHPDVAALAKAAQAAPQGAGGAGPASPARPIAKAPAGRTGKQEPK